MKIAQESAAPMCHTNGSTGMVTRHLTCSRRLSLCFCGWLALQSNMGEKSRIANNYALISLAPRPAMKTKLGLLLGRVRRPLQQVLRPQNRGE